MTHPACWWACPVRCAANRGPLCISAWRKLAPHCPQTSRLPLSQASHADRTGKLTYEWRRKRNLKAGDSEERVRVIWTTNKHQIVCMEFYDTPADAHIVLQKTEVFSPKRSVRQGCHLTQIKCRQPDSGPFSAKTQRGKVHSKCYLQVPKSWSYWIMKQWLTLG